MKKILLYIFSLIVFVGCAKEADFYQLEPSGISDEKWWKAYNNQELNASLDKYFDGDYELKNKILMMEHLSVENDILRNYFLSAKLDASINKSLDNNTHTTRYGGNLGINYKLDIFGKRADQKRAKTLELMALQDEYHDIKQQNAHKIIELILNREYFLKTKKYMEQKAQNLEKIYELSAYENDLGKLEYERLLDDKTRLDNAKISLVYNEMEINKINKTFKDLGFEYDGAKLQLEDFDEYLKKLSISKYQLVNNFSILAKNKKVQIKNINYLINQKDMYVDVSLNSFLSSSSDDIKTMFNFGVFGGGVGIDLGFLDYFNVKDKIKLSKLEYEMAKNEYENYIKTTLNAMQNSLDDYVFYQKLLNINENILASSKKSYEQKLFKYQLKMISTKEFLMYENAYLDALMGTYKALLELDKAKSLILRMFWQSTSKP